VLCILYELCAFAAYVNLQIEIFLADCCAIGGMRADCCAVGRMKAGPARPSSVNAMCVVGPLLFIAAQDGRVTIWDLDCLEYITQFRVSDAEVMPFVSSFDFLFQLCIMPTPGHSHDHYYNCAYCNSFSRWQHQTVEQIATLC